MNSSDKMIDLRDIFAEGIFKWKLIILSAIIGCMVGGGIYQIKIHQYQAELMAQQAERNAIVETDEEAEDDELTVHNGAYDEQMAEAKAILTQLQITKVDGLYAQYAANIQLRDSLADNINNSVIMKMDADNAAVTRLMYTLNSDQDYIANNLNSLIITDDLLKKTARVLGEDVSSKYLQDLLSVWKGSTGVTGDSFHVYEDERTTSVVYLQAIAYTEEQSDEIAELMTKALERAIEQMKDVDPDIEIQRVGDVSLGVTSSTIDDVQRTLVTELNNVANQIATIEGTEIPKLSEDEKTYYDLLVSEGKGIHVDEPEDADMVDEAEAAPETVTLTPPSKAKYVLLGIIGGACLAVVALFLYLFLLSKKSRSLTGIESVTGIPTLAVFERRLAKVKDPIIRAGINLQTGDKAVENEAAYQPILQVRIQELLQQNGKESLYLLGDDVSALTSEAGHAIIGGEPETSTEAMQAFLRSDSVILVTRMYHTEISAISNAVDLCKVHGKQILGNIVIYEA